MADPAVSEEKLLDAATRRADAKLGFRGHALIYGLVNAGLATLNMVTSPGYPWFIWPLFGWGIGLAAHGVAVYAPNTAMREHSIAKEVERLRAGR